MSSLVYLRNKTNNRVYVYTNERNGERNGKPTYVRRCIGHLDEDTGEIVPNTPRSDSPKAELRFTGLSKAIMDISDRIGLSDSLKVTFGPIWKDILTCAMYGLTGNTDLSSIERWSSRFDTPSGRVLKKEDVESLLTTINYDDIEIFQRIWRKKVKDRRIYHISISPSMSFDIRDFSPKTEYGRLYSMPTMDMDIVYGMDSLLPISYETLPGKVMSLEDIITSEDRYQWINPTDTEYILNEEYCTGNNVDVLVVSDRRFMIRLPSNHRILKSAMGDMQDEIMRYSNYKHSRGGYNFINTESVEIAHKNCYMHIYYSAEEAEKEMGTFLAILDRCRVELSTDHLVSAHTELYGKYFNMNGPDMEVELNSTSIMETTKYAGMTVILSDCVVDPVKAMDCFKMNSFAERTFDNIFNNVDHLGLKLYLRHNMISRYFIQFVTLILKSSIRKSMIDNNLHRDHTVEDLVRSLSNLATVSLSDRRRPLGMDVDHLQSLFLETIGTTFD
ncbi:MAG: hypothetical protein E7Z67_03295 [Thermoplasmata archaeon]|nr:hypothetical protein [Thermoplasmata archaeon]